MSWLKKRWRTRGRPLKPANPGGGSAPGRPWGPQPTGWLLKPDHHPVPNVAQKRPIIRPG